MSDSPEPLPEEELVQLFREAGDGFLADRPQIVLGAVERGRALRRRRAASVVGGMAALAVIAGGGAVLASVPGGGGRSDRTAADSATSTGMTDQEMVAALRPHLDGWRIVDVRGTGTAGSTEAGTAPLVEIAVDDGHGRAGVRTAVWRDTVRTVLQSTSCPEPQHPEVACNRVTLPDGSALMTWKSGYADSGAKSWWCLLATPSGKRVSVTEWNSSEPGESTSRTDPPLTVDQLRVIAVDPVWDRAVEDTGLRGDTAQH
ncbi:hypothetical protein [Kitasatospora sp. DSM 101779]|uniref:hypothetical protein n=1 Tax=Kitasatospora sp. DSM 101779 TaxID=2853165 RepID=UPI0021DAEBC1|nr:hypothetical protein [Kitasatospora sp. DSM 101779]MCU7824085.1 hypothetical protein [Kitasatospora sp. DSM 101779]